MISNFRLANVVGPRNVAGPLPIFLIASKIINSVSLPRREETLFMSWILQNALSKLFMEKAGAYHFSSGKDVAILELYDEVVKSMRLNEYPQLKLRI